MKYDVQFTNQFKKDMKRAAKQKKNIEELYSVIEKIANGEKLGARYRDHLLSGNYEGCHGCHILPDWLLIYEIKDSVSILLLDRLGSHADLF